MISVGLANSSSPNTRILPLGSPKLLGTHWGECAALVQLPCCGSDHKLFTSSLHPSWCSGSSSPGRRQRFRGGDHIALGSQSAEAGPHPESWWGSRCAQSCPHAFPLSTGPQETCPSLPPVGHPTCTEHLPGPSTLSMHWPQNRA